jgi:hypothetical protein
MVRRSKGIYLQRQIAFPNPFLDNLNKMAMKWLKKYRVNNGKEFPDNPR